MTTKIIVPVAQAQKKPAVKPVKKARLSGFNKRLAEGQVVTKVTFQIGQNVTRGLAIFTFYFFIPEVMVLFRPGLIDITCFHSFQRTFGSDRTYVDMTERSGDQK